MHRAKSPGEPPGWRSAAAANHRTSPTATSATVPQASNPDARRCCSEDILAAAREMQGLESIDQVKFAVLERAGQISIIPR